MKKYLLMTTALLLMAVASIYGANKKEEVRPMPQFNVVNVMGNVVVIFEQSNKYEVHLTGDEDEIAQILTDVSGESLNIRRRSIQVGNVSVETSSSAKVYVYVRSPEVKTFNLAGSGDILAEKLNAKQVVFNLAGSGRIMLGFINAESARFNNAGSSYISVENVKADNISMSMSGSGSINCIIKKATNLTCSLVGSGKICLGGNVDKYSKSMFGPGKIYDQELSYRSMSMNDTYNNGNSRESVVINGNDKKSKPQSPNGIINAKP